MALSATELVPAIVTDYQARFTKGIKKLTEALGTTARLDMTAGTTMKVYKSTVTLQDGNVAEGAMIPISSYKKEVAGTFELTPKKHAFSTSAEKVQQYGFKVAFSEMNDEALRALQNEFRTGLFSFIGGNAQTTTAKTLQGAFAKALNNVLTVFEDMDQSPVPVIFVNPNDITDYLAEKEISVQSDFGINYVQNFMGTSTLILNTSVPVNHVYTTAASNLVIAAAKLTGGELASLFQFNVDQTGLIGTHVDVDYSNLTARSTWLSYMTFYAEVADGVIDITITPEEAEAPEA